MSRVFPPTCPPPASLHQEASALPAGAVVPPAAVHAVSPTADPGALETRQSWEPLHSTDRYRYALVFDDRARDEVQPQPPAR